MNFFFIFTALQTDPAPCRETTAAFDFESGFLP